MHSAYLSVSPILRTFRAYALLAPLILSQLHGTPRDQYELRGQVLNASGKPFRRVLPMIFLQGATTPYTAKTFAGRDGKFRFKKLRPAMYSLIIAVPERGEMHQTVEVSPSFADSRGRIETTFHFQRNYSIEDARTVSFKSLTIPKKARSEYQKAEDRLEKHDVAGAVKHLKAAVGRAPQFSAAWNLLGTIAYQSENYAESEGYFREALKQAPNSYAPLVNLGGALLSLGKIQESLSINLRAVETRPDDPLAHSQLGLTYFMLGQLEKAEKHLKQAKVLDPRHFSTPRLILARIYLGRQDYWALVGELQEFLQHHPDWVTAPEIRDALEEAQTMIQEGPSPR